MQLSGTHQVLIYAEHYSVMRHFTAAESEVYGLCNPVELAEVRSSSGNLLLLVAALFALFSMVLVNMRQVFRV
jgi:hypothetical protein